MSFQARLMSQVPTLIKACWDCRWPPPHPPFRVGPRNRTWVIRLVWQGFLPHRAILLALAGILFSFFFYHIFFVYLGGGFKGLDMHVPAELELEDTLWLAVLLKVVGYRDWTQGHQTGVASWGFLQCHRQAHRHLFRYPFPCRWLRPPAQGTVTQTPTKGHCEAPLCPCAGTPASQTAKNSERVLDQCNRSPWIRAYTRRKQ